MGWVFLLDNHKQGLWRQDFAFFIFKGKGLVRAEIQKNKNEANVYKWAKAMFMEGRDLCNQFMDKDYL